MNLEKGECYDTSITSNTIIIKRTGVPCGAVGSGSGVVPAAAWVTAVACVQSLAQELPHSMSAAKKKKEKQRKAQQIYGIKG